MKYIRTKDGIYSRGKIICYAFRQDYQSEDWDKDIESYLQTPILKQANTIEELCDEFVIVSKKKHKIKEVTKIIYSKRQLINNNIYGEIWVFDSDGVPTLKPVAQMNDKGELELL